MRQTVIMPQWPAHRTQERTRWDSCDIFRPQSSTDTRGTERHERLSDLLQDREHVERSILMLSRISPYCTLVCPWSRCSRLLSLITQAAMVRAAAQHCTPLPAVLESGKHARSSVNSHQIKLVLSRSFEARHVLSCSWNSLHYSPIETIHTGPADYISFLSSGWRPRMACCESKCDGLRESSTSPRQQSFVRDTW